MVNRRRGDASSGFPVDGDFGDRRLLFIDMPAELLAALATASETAPVNTTFSALNIDLIARHDPHIVLAPLVGPGFDILDVAARLQRCGFTGSLRALTTPLPNLSSVRTEIRSHCTGLDVDIVVVSPPAATGH